MMSGEVATAVTLLGFGLIALIIDLGYDVVLKLKARRRERSARS